MSIQSSHVRWFSDCDSNMIEEVGGKCSSLGELIQAGVRVPPGFAVTTAAYREFMSANTVLHEVEAMLAGIDHDDIARLETVSQEIRERIQQTPFSTRMEDEIAHFYTRLSLVCCMPATPVAVRSSATAEDLPGASFAGQQDTYLWIRGVDDILDRVRRCTASLFTARAIAYRQKMRFRHTDVGISVGVQKMANSFTAGVMFTLNPSNGDRSSVVIDANFGFGESVVSGEVTPDQFRVNKVSLEVMERNISDKTILYTVDHKAHKTVKAEVPDERRKVQSVTDEELTELARMAKAIERHYGRPMDIEWAIDKDMPKGSNVFILQARPETVWSGKDGTVASSAGGTSSPLDHILANMLAGKKLVH